jgi:hypothetical protein
MTEARWTRFLFWTATGTVVGFAVLDITSIGLYLLPISLIFIVALSQAFRLFVFPDVLGVIEGIAANLLWGAFISHGIPPCQPGVPLQAEMPLRLGEMVTASCTNIKSQLWLVSGMAVATSGLLAYLLARTLARRRHTELA